jgi:uncharacterized protein YdcH (DUF465 family)
VALSQIARPARRRGEPKKEHVMDETGDLRALFPGEGLILNALCLEDSQFRALSDRHIELATEIRRIESGLAPASEKRLGALKKEYQLLLEEVADTIASRKAE